MDEKGIKFSFNDAVADFIAKESFSLKYGARNMRRYIQKHIEDEIANKIIEDFSGEVSVISLDFSSKNNNIIIKCK